MKIDRTRLLDALERFAFAGNGVVVGAPGVGKSYSLVSLRRRLRSKSIPHLFLAIDQLGSGTEEELRSELAYQGDLIGKLRMELERSGGGRGLLIIDAFDAARSDVKQRNFLRIIRQAVKELRGSWNVIVSVRTYDAERSQELLDLFSERSGDVPASLYRENRIPCRHFKIPLLDETEVIRAVAQIREGRVAYEQGSEDFRELLRIPFNLWLLEKLLSEWENSASTTEIGEARSQVQLLQLFWNRRVRGARDGDQREVALTRITQAMVAERTLSMRKENAFALASEETWRSLFSDGVLEEASSTGQHVGYSHNLLFDFAVSVLLIEDDPDAVIS